MSSDAPKLIGGHHEDCDVLQPAPDLGPSQKPCNCRPILGAPECTGILAQWCPIHGDCKCDRENDILNSPDCPLHCNESTHAEESHDHP